MNRSRLRRGLVLIPLVLALMGVVLERSTNAAFPGQNGKIAFHRVVGRFAIFTINPDGSGLTMLTSTLSNNENPAWSPDGSKIVFMSDRDGNFEIYSMNADGSGQTRLTNNTSADEFPAWSADGTKIVFTSNRDGNVGNFEIYSMNADGSGQTRLTNNPASDFAPAWSPDGTKIAFNSTREGNDEIYTMNSDGSNPVRLTNNPPSDTDPNWSPDGTKLVFHRSSEIYSMNADGSDLMNLAQNPAFDADPAWSPDGSMITFTTNRNGLFQITVMNADGSGQTAISAGSPLEGFPDWQPLVPSVITVLVDIKPGSTRNPINLSSHGVIPVAILTTDIFDATTVDPSTVCFGDDDNPAQRDCTEAHGRGHIEDVNSDGRPDLLLHYETNQTGIDPGDTEACLTGETFDGLEVEGCDAIKTR